MGLIEKAKEYVQEKIENIPKPEANLEGMKLEGVGWDGISYKATLAIMNPYPNSIPLCDVAYILKSDARVILTGNMPDPGDLEGKQKITKLEMGLKVPHSVVMSLVKDIWADWDIDYELEVILTIDVPVIGSFQLRLSQTGEVKLPTISSFWRGGDNEEKDKDNDTNEEGDEESKDKKKDKDGNGQHKKDKKKDKDENKDEDEDEKGTFKFSIRRGGGSDDEKDNKNKDKDTNEKNDKESKDKKTDDEGEEKNEHKIPFFSSLLSRSKSDDENDKDEDDQHNKKKKKDKDENEDEDRK